MNKKILPVDPTNESIHGGINLISAGIMACNQMHGHTVAALFLSITSRRGHELLEDFDTWRNEKPERSSMGFDDYMIALIQDQGFKLAMPKVCALREQAHGLLGHNARKILDFIHVLKGNQLEHWAKVHFGVESEVMHEIVFPNLCVGCHHKQCPLNAEAN